MLKSLLPIIWWLLCLSTLTSAHAQVTAPSRGGDINILQITSSSIKLTVGVNGTGQGRVVAVAATTGISSVSMPIANGLFYTGSLTYGQGDKIGQGYAVYSGPEHAITITGLQPGTSYYITSAEYNADSATIVYNTTGNSLVMPTRRATSVAPLPVVLSAFTGTVSAQALAILHWITASEFNTEYFAVERSTDGQDFNEAGRQVAAGSSSQSVTYHFTDSRPLVTTTYYRLRQVDLDGTVHYSSTITLIPLSHSLEREFVVYPNPGASQSFQLSLQGYNNESLDLKLFDALGRPIMSRMLTPTDTYYLASLGLPSNLAPGAYTLTLLSTAGPLYKKVIITE